MPRRRTRRRTRRPSRRATRKANRLNLALAAVNAVSKAMQAGERAKAQAIREQNTLSTMQARKANQRRKAELHQIEVQKRAYELELIQLRIQNERRKANEPKLNADPHAALLANLGVNVKNNEVKSCPNGCGYYDFSGKETKCRYCGAYLRRQNDDPYMLT